MSDTDPASSRPDTPGETGAGSAPPPGPTDRPTPATPAPAPQYNPTQTPIASSPESPDEPVATPPVAPPSYEPPVESAPVPPTPNPAPVYSPTPTAPVTTPPSAPSGPATTDTAPAAESAPAFGSGADTPEQAPAHLGSAGSADDDDDNDDDDDDDDDDDEWDEVPARDQQALRWVGMVTSVGVGIVSVIALQVLISLYEGLSFKVGERIQSADFPGVTDDLLHRIGYAFAGLGTTSQIFLIVAVVLISLPPVLGGRLTDKQYRNTGIALRVATVLAITVAVGTLLWVRASLNEYSVKDVAVPRFVRIEYTNALLGTLTASALAIFASLTAHPLREWDR